MDFGVVWTETATDDLEAITTYLAQHSATAAERISSEIVRRVELLQTVPLMGAVYPSGSPGPNRVTVCGKYRIFYRVQEDARRVEILTVRHSARSEPDLPG
jgi:plasmid stabilization system protein ParE